MCIIDMNSWLNLSFALEHLLERIKGLNKIEKKKGETIFCKKKIFICKNLNLFVMKVFFFIFIIIEIISNFVITVCMFFRTSAATVRAWLKALVETNDLFIWTLSFWGTSPNGLISFIWSPTHSKYLSSNLYWLFNTVNIFW